VVAVFSGNQIAVTGTIHTVISGNPFDATFTFTGTRSP
jgi:hypothetical protein